MSGAYRVESSNRLKYSGIDDGEEVAVEPSLLVEDGPAQAERPVAERRHEGWRDVERGGVGAALDRAVPLPLVEVEAEELLPVAGDPDPGAVHQDERAHADHGRDHQAHALVQERDAFFPRQQCRHVGAKGIEGAARRLQAGAEHLLDDPRLVRHPAPFGGLDLLAGGVEMEGGVSGKGDQDRPSPIHSSAAREAERLPGARSRAASTCPSMACPAPGFLHAGLHQRARQASSDPPERGEIPFGAWADAPAERRGPRGRPPGRSRATRGQTRVDLESTKAMLPSNRGSAPRKPGSCSRWRLRRWPPGRPRPRRSAGRRSAIAALGTWIW